MMSLEKTHETQKIFDKYENIIEMAIWDQTNN